MKAAEKIKSYILAAINFEGENGKTFTTEEEKITELIRRFKCEYWYPANQQRYGTMTKAMASWLQGLPTGIDIAFYYDEIDSLLIEWGYLKHTSREATIDRERDHYWLYLAGSLVDIAKRYSLA
ncbi:hypothetical protein MVUOKPPV_CDS0288 [Klebsiella phage phi1_175008]|uniref:Uncharacterized protein n=2 Tax=Klebsiella phage phi1_175008 TaxID=3127744 RepID=A0AC61ZSX6_9CAUD